MSDIKELNLYIDTRPNSITMSHGDSRKIKYIYHDESDFLWTLGLLEEIKEDTIRMLEELLDKFKRGSWAGNNIELEAKIKELKEQRK